MSKCFISYRHTKPDEDLARFLEKFLREHDQNVFLDTRIQVGMEWVKEIETQIKAAEFFIVFIVQRVHPQRYGPARSKTGR